MVDGRPDIADFARLWKKAVEDQLGYRVREILRVSLHPLDFEVVARTAAFVPSPRTPDTPADFRGKLWGVDICCDARNEKGVAYVVTKSTNPPSPQQIGNRMYIVVTPDPERRTSWSRILDDDGLV